MPSLSSPKPKFSPCLVPFMNYRTVALYGGSLVCVIVFVFACMSPRNQTNAFN